MSVIFMLSGNSLDIEQWDELLRQWAEEQPFALFETPAFAAAETGAPGEFDAFVWGQGSTRGVLLTRKEQAGEVDVRLSALSSRRDWINAFEILRRAHERGGGELEREGLPYDDSQLTPEQAEQEAVEDFCFSAQAVLTASSHHTQPDPDAPDPRRVVKIPLPHFVLEVSADELEDCTPERVPEIEANLAQRVEKYGSAHRSSLMIVNNSRPMAMWALAPTVIPEVDYVAVKGKETMVVPLGRLREVLGERAETLATAGPELLVYLPELDPIADRAVLDELKRAAVDLEAEAKRGCGATAAMLLCALLIWLL